jgi:multicomponent Na+:H+ antiporter subunit D
MSTLASYPFLIFYVGALLAALTGGKLRGAIMLAVPIIGAFNLWFLPEAGLTTLTVLEYNLTPVRIDPLGMLFGILFHFAAFLAFLFSLQVKDTVQHVSGMLYAGSAVGAVFAGDLVTLFVFFEMLAITSVFLILARRTEAALTSSIRYLVIQITSGMLLLAGIVIHAMETGSIEFTKIGLDVAGGWLIFLAFGIKCAFPLVHNWVTDSYAEATPTGAVFLCAFTTKTAVYALARGYPGTELLVYIGAVMTMFPIFYAVIENDLRRVLAYSMINQLGFMVCGIGIGTALAINGAVSHAFAHVIYKMLLFMSMGAVLQQTGKINGSDLGGLYKSMPWTTGFCIVGAASISAFPLFSGFISKSMVITAALQQGYDWVWVALLFASAGVFHHAGIKVPFFAFFAHDSGIRTTEAPRNMLLAMAMASAVSIGVGVYPAALYVLLPFPVDYLPYTASHVLTQCQLLFYSALAFYALKITGIYPPELPSTNLDVEWTYRKALPAAAKDLVGAIAPIDRSIRAGTLRLVEWAIAATVRHAGPHGILARTWSVGGMVAWVIMLLGLYLVLNFATP